MTYPRILLLEDIAFDREMIRSTLLGAGVGGQFYCVETREAFLSVLKNTTIDLILADYSLPSFDGLSALEIVRRQYPGIPFILVTGVLGEELAIETLKQGATDYVLKQRLDRLVLAVKRALRERQERQARLRAESALKVSEDRFQVSLEIMLDCFGIYTALRDDAGQIVDFCIEYVNRAAIKQLSVAGEVPLGERLCDRFPIHRQTGLFDAYRQVVETGLPLMQEFWLQPSTPSPEAAAPAAPSGSAPKGSPEQQPLNLLLQDLSEQSKEHPTALLESPVLSTAVALDVRAARFGDGVVVTWRDVTARRRAEQEREELLAREKAARQEAEAANRVKDEFLATLSHELRTPLNAMQGWLQLLERRSLGEQMMSQAFQTIQRNLDALKRLIEDVLDVSRIIRGDLRLQIEPLEITPVVRAAVEVVLPAVQAKNIILVADFDPEVEYVRGDRNRLQQVIWNLLSNAVKFTPPGGRIDVRLGKAGDQVQIQVQDTGKGIDAAFLPHIFERFYQGDSSLTRSHTGLGLGLAIVRHLMELHGGSIQADSPGPGQGATFTVLLPRMVKDDSEEAAAEVPTSELLAPERPASELFIGEGSDTRPAQSPFPDNETVAHITDLAPAACPDLGEVRVLLVEADPSVKEHYITMLTATGAIVHAVSSVEEAVSLLLQFRPHILVSDLELPDGDGYTLIRQVRALEPQLRAPLPAIALAPSGPLEVPPQGGESGFQVHLQKPVEITQLATAVAHLTETSAAS